MIKAALIAALMPGMAVASTCFQRDWEEVEHSHRDLGHGRVEWVWSWSFEGVADDIHVLDCASGKGIKVRARSERMQSPIPFDRREKARAIIDRAASAPHFLRFDHLSEDLARARMTAQALVPKAEPCACATYYPGAFASGTR